MESYFSLAQWQELELQALIYRYIVAGAAVPPELLQPIYFLHSNFSTSHHPPAAACKSLDASMIPPPCTIPTFILARNFWILMHLVRFWIGRHSSCLDSLVLVLVTVKQLLDSIA